MEAAKEFFPNIDFTKFWSHYQDYVNPNPVTDEMVAQAEAACGYKLPKAYIALMKTQNGGDPSKVAFPTTKPTSWSNNHIQITSVHPIGTNNCISSLDMIEEWQYPKIGLVLCECPSGGHDVVMLDYSESGPQGEPKIIHYDQELEEYTFLAKNVQDFINGLVDPEVFEISEKDDASD